MSIRNNTLLELDEFVPYRLSLLSNTVSAAIASSYVERFKLTIPEWRIMAVLGRFPGITAGTVAQRTAMDKVAVSRALARLQSAGYLRRKGDKTDRRRSLLQLSAAGDRLYQRIAPLAMDFENQLLDSLTERDRRHLDRLLTQLMERAREL
jgi:DNA-binding MarR family transcriptional regulator